MDNAKSSSRPHLESLSPSGSFLSKTLFRPYWWDAIAWDRGVPSSEIPRETDVLIVGGGYTGCSAALTLALAGAKVVVVDAQRVGEGASTRNGGQVLAGVKRPFDEIAKDYGHEIAEKIVTETEASFDFFEARLKSLDDNAHYMRSGIFIGAHSQKVFEGMKRRAPRLREATIVNPANVQCEVGTKAFHGGMIMARGGQIHPALYHQALADACLKAGAQLFDFGKVIAVQKIKDSFETEIDTLSPSTGNFEKRLIRSKEVLLATNGYTPTSMHWLASRLVPVSSHMIATEPLDEALIQKLMPGLRAVSDTHRMLSYFRVSPDRRRLLFGGRASFKELDLPNCSQRLHRMMSSFFPELQNAQVSHAWLGKVAFAADMLPHFGVTPEGLHYSAPYNGRGVALGTYLGHRVALRMLGKAQPGESLDGLDHRRIYPGYTGAPWFLPMVGLWYQIQDMCDDWRNTIAGRLKKRPFA